jgi:hypothetical protein
MIRVVFTSTLCLAEEGFATINFVLRGFLYQSVVFFKNDLIFSKLLKLYQKLGIKDTLLLRLVSIVILFFQVKL